MDTKKNKLKVAIVPIKVTATLLEENPQLSEAGIEEGDEVALVGGRPDDRHPK